MGLNLNNSQQKLYCNMNKKQITIDTQFFDDGIEATLKAYHDEEDGPYYIQSRQAQSQGITQGNMQSSYSRSSQHSYQHHNSYQTHSNNGQSYQTSYNVRKSQQESWRRKQQTAELFQNLLSKIMADLFIKCWNSLKGLLPQYDYLRESTAQKYGKEKNSLMKTTQLIGQKREEQHKLMEQTMNPFTEKLVSADRKKQIVERHQRGITLDSLSKHKLNHSKSVTQMLPERDKPFKSNMQSKDTRANLLTNQQTYQRTLDRQGGGRQQGYQQQGEEELGASRKSYRQKFKQYKHRSKSRTDNYVGQTNHSQYRKKLQPYPSVRRLEQPKKDWSNYYSLNNLNKETSYHQQQNSTADINGYKKNELLRNISHILLQRENNIQGEDQRYYLNHQDRYRGKFSNNYSSGLHKISDFSNRWRVSQDQISRQVYQRAHLLQQIVQKLNYPKLKIETISNHEHDKEDQTLQKLARLQRMLTELKQNQTPSRVRTQYPQPWNPRNLSEHINRKQEEQLYRKFMEELKLIRSQVNQIKNKSSSQSNQHQTAHLIQEQRKIISKYQQMMANKPSEPKSYQSPTRKQDKIQTQNTGQKGFFQQLIEQNKTGGKKVGWEEGWGQVVHQEVQINPNQRSRKRHQHLNRFANNQVYRYTRNQILESIGKKQVVQAQQRAMRQQQARILLDRQRRQQQIRKMTQNVRIRRQQLQVTESIQKNRPARQAYQREWEKFQNTRIDVDERDSHCCPLFPC